MKIDSGSNRPQAISPLLLSVADAAQTLGISRGSLYRLLFNAEIRYVRVLDRRLIEIEDLKRFIAAQQIGSDSPACSRRRPKAGERAR